MPAPAAIPVHNHGRRPVWTALLTLLWLLSSTPDATVVRADNTSFSTEQIEFFEERIRPLLSQHCYKCHSQRTKEPKGGLKLDRREHLLIGGDSGPAIVAGKPEQSLLIKAVRYQSVEMPPIGQLTETQIALLEKWVVLGAPWPMETSLPAGQTRESKAYDFSRLREKHWSFHAIQRPTLPHVSRQHWGHNAIDRFVLARLEGADLSPSPPATPRILCRRIYFDLTGLPPAPEEVDAFLKAARNNLQQAIQNLGDQLLSSPHYGERWARHWLDVARYADDLPHAWRYRDWVINALNQDLPYDQFLRLQIAGDLAETPVATGFFALGPTYRSDGGDPQSVAQSKSETLDDRMDTFSRGLLALTVSCARCHDHKFDPIPTQDYYSLAGVFNNTGTTDPKTGLHALNESGSANMKVALHGNLLKPGALAPRRFLRILSGAERPNFTRGSGRSELAEAVTDANNPLTARVIVNRVWQHHFGRAIVRTPSNFGILGETPTHPQLLDWLASEFIQSGWSLKNLHRTIIASATYQMRSQMEQSAFEVDGDNRLIWRMNPRRLGAESWRDTLLSVTGVLDRKLAGPPTDDVHARRRTVYFKASRNGDKFATDRFLRLFDFPLMRATVAKRVTSIAPQQFLFLLNSPIMLDRARELSARIESSANDNPTRVHNAYRLLFGRPPSTQEREIAIAFLEPGHGEKTRDASANPPSENDDLLIADFEGDTYGDWKVTGEAFGPGPAKGALPNQMGVSGFLGRGLVNTFYQGDKTTGTLTSPPLQLQRKYIHFLVGGGKYPGNTCIELLIDKKTVRTATGPNDRSGGSEQLAWKTWDISDLRNKSAVIRIVDRRTGGWGHINIDHLFQSNRPLNTDHIPQNNNPSITKPKLTPWQQYAQVLLSSNELMFVR